MTPAAVQIFPDPNPVPSRLGSPPGCAVSVLTLNAGWPEDLVRFARALERWGGQMALSASPTLADPVSSRQE
ncbi:MAG: hypothetical protein NVSMB32_05020 [Actinomycetota bacterium]